MVYRYNKYTASQLVATLFGYCFSFNIAVLHWSIDQTLVNSLHSLLNCEIGGLDCSVITIEDIIISCPLNKCVTPIWQCIGPCDLSVTPMWQCIGPCDLFVKPFWQCIGPCDLFRIFRSIFVYNTCYNNLFINVSI